MVAVVQQQAGVKATQPTTMGAIDSGWWLGDLVVALVPEQRVRISAQMHAFALWRRRDDG